VESDKFCQFAGMSRNQCSASDVEVSLETTMRSLTPEPTMPGVFNSKSSTEPHRNPASTTVKLAVMWEPTEHTSCMAETVYSETFLSQFEVNGFTTVIPK